METFQPLRCHKSNLNSFSIEKDNMLKCRTIHPQNFGMCGLFCFFLLKNKKFNLTLCCRRSPHWKSIEKYLKITTHILLNRTLYQQLAFHPEHKRDTQTIFWHSIFFSCVCRFICLPAIISTYTTRERVDKKRVKTCHLKYFLFQNKLKGKKNCWPFSFVCPSSLSCCLFMHIFHFCQLVITMVYLPYQTLLSVDNVFLIYFF